MSNTGEASEAPVSAPLGDLPGHPYQAEDALRDAIQMLKTARGEYLQAAVRLRHLQAEGRIVREPGLNGTGELAFTDRPTFTTVFAEMGGRFEPKIHLSDDVYTYLPGFELQRSPTPEQRTQNAVLLAGILYHELFHLEHPPGRNVVNPKVIEPPAWELEMGCYQDLIRAHHGMPRLQLLIRNVGAGREAEGRQNGYLSEESRFGPR